MLDEQQTTFVRFAVIAESGQIIRMGQTPDYMLDAQADEGQTAIDVTGIDIDDDTHYFHKGGFVQYPERSGDWAKFDFEQRKWFDPRTNADFERLFREAKGEAIHEIEQWFNRYRKGYITPIEGQSTVYQLKKDEAQRFKADPSPVLLNYPLIEAEVGITADTPDNVAEVYLQLNDIMMTALAISEKVRLYYGVQIEAAGTINDIAETMAQFNQVVANL